MSEPRCEMCQGWKILIFNTHKKSFSVSAPFRRRSWIAGITRAQIELVCFFITSRLDSTGAQRPNKRRISRQAESMFTADYPITRWFRYSKRVREGVEEHSGSNLAAGEAGKWIGQLTPSNYFRFPEKKKATHRERTRERKISCGHELGGECGERHSWDLGGNLGFADLSRPSLPLPNQFTAPEKSFTDYSHTPVEMAKICSRRFPHVQA